MAAPMNVLAFAAAALLLYLLIRAIIQDNIPIAIAAVFMSVTLRSGLALAALPDRFLAGQGCILLGIVCASALTGAALLWRSRKPHGRSQKPHGVANP